MTSDQSDNLPPLQRKVFRALEARRLTYTELLIALRPVSTQGLSNALYRLQDGGLVACGGWNGTTYGWAELAR